MDRRRKILFFAPIVTALWFLNTFALRYLTEDAGTLGIYWSRRQSLYAHIGGGVLPLFLGPVLLWLGLEGTHKPAHRMTFLGYVLSVGISGTSALYLAFHTDFGFVVGLGFTWMAIAWLIATLLAAAALWRNLLQQYREWLIRSYVLTFAAVTFRILFEIFNLWGHGTLVEQMSAACWLSWSVPLMIAEAVLQGRKILTPIEKPEPKDAWVSIAKAASN